MHEEDPISLCPPTQTSQVSLPPVLNVLASQATTSERSPFGFCPALTVLQKAAPLLLYFPALVQSVHVVSPNATYLPAAHGTHALLLTTFPGSQLVQVLASAASRRGREGELVLLNAKNKDK